MSNTKAKLLDIQKEDEEREIAHKKAYETIPFFINKLNTSKQASYLVKIKLVDKERSSKENKIYIYMWLNDIFYDEQTKEFEGEFFEVPQALEDEYEVGDVLVFKDTGIYDWMIMENKNLEGGFTIRLNRPRLESDDEKYDFDSYLGVKNYIPLP